MAVTNVYTLSHFIVDRAADLVVGGITDCNLDGGATEALLSGDGLPDPRYVGVASCAPILSFTTTQLSGLLAEGTNTFAINGLALGAAAIGKAWLQKMAEGAVRTGGATSVLLAINEGIPPNVDGREGRKSVELVEAIYRSSETGKLVPLKYQ